MAKIVNKTVNLTLVGLNGNAFALMGAFQERAKEEGWTKEEIDKVLNAAMEGNYEHLIRTLDDHCEKTDDEDE